MHEILQGLESQLAAALGGLDQKQTQLAPAHSPEKWNIQQIVEHLLMSYRTTVQVFETRIEKGSPTKARPMLRQRLAQVTLIGMGHFPSGRKAPSAVCPTLPATLKSGEGLTRRVHEELSAVDESAAKAEGLFRGEACASHMVLGPLSIAQWRKFHLVHGMHHVKQIRSIRRDHRV